LGSAEAGVREMREKTCQEVNAASQAAWVNLTLALVCVVLALVTITIIPMILWKLSSGVAARAVISVTPMTMGVALFRLVVGRLRQMDKYLNVRQGILTTAAHVELSPSNLKNEAEHLHNIGLEVNREPHTVEDLRALWSAIFNRKGTLNSCEQTK
jgi:hypothetical protein